MVDQIKNIISNSVKQTKSRVDNQNKANFNVTDAKSVDNSSSTTKNISQFVKSDQTKEMSKEPPINKENISRIKNAISSGSYPIDIDKISEALLSAYNEMK